MRPKTIRIPEAMTIPPTPEEIRRFRHRFGLTQAALGRALGYRVRPERTVQEWEAGRRPPVRYLRLALEGLAYRLTGRADTALWQE